VEVNKLAKDSLLSRLFDVQPFSALDRLCHMLCCEPV